MEKYYDLDSNEVMPEVSFDPKYPYKTFRLDACEIGLQWLYVHHRQVFAGMSLHIIDASPPPRKKRGEGQ